MAAKQQVIGHALVLPTGSGIAGRFVPDRQVEQRVPAVAPADDRFMLCVRPVLLDEHGFQISPRNGEPGDCVIERAFIER